MHTQQRHIHSQGAFICQKSLSWHRRQANLRYFRLVLFKFLKDGYIQQLFPYIPGAIARQIHGDYLIFFQVYMFNGLQPSDDRYIMFLSLIHI